MDFDTGVSSSGQEPSCGVCIWRFEEDCSAEHEGTVVGQEWPGGDEFVLEP
jgi:hypothetical protein